MMIEKINSPATREKDYKLKAGVLLYALFVSFFVAIICSSLVLLFYFHNKEFYRQCSYFIILHHVNSGINLFLNSPQLLVSGERKEVQLFADDEHSKVIGLIKPWGYYQVLTISAEKELVHIEKTLLCGQHYSRDDFPAFYLSDQNQSLYVSGNTFIRGQCFIPRGLAKMAFVEGSNYKGERLIYGEVYESEKNLPLALSLPNDNNDPGGRDSILTYETLKADTIIHSFRDKTLRITSQDIINIDYKCIHGNVVVESSMSVSVGSNSSLEDVLLIAPYIFIGKGFKGTIQAFATDSIIVDKGASLLFPSTLSLVSEGKSCLIFKENASISGTVLLKSETTSNSQLSVLTLSTGVIVNGLVYCNGYLQHEGTINGSVYCYKTLHKTFSGIYENHLVNATIDQESLSPYFVNAVIFNHAATLKEIKCLY